MYSFIKLENKVFPVQSVEENLSLETQLKVNWPPSEAFRNSFLKPYYSLQFQLTRFLADDTFNLKLTYQKSTMANFFTKVNLNGNILINSALGGDYSYSSAGGGWPGDVVLHSTMHNKPLRDVSDIVAHYSYTYLKTGTNDDFIKNSTNFISLKVIPKVVSIGNHYSLQEDEVLILRSPKTFSTMLDFTHINNESDLSYEGDPNRIFDWKISYTNLVFVPIHLERAKPTTNVFKIYAFNEDDSSVESDHTLSKVDYLSSQFKTKLNGAFIPQSEPKPLKFELVDDSLVYSSYTAREIGVYQITDSTFFDYEKNQAVIGSSLESVVGEVYPYSLKGEYKREFSIDASATFKNVKVNVFDKIDQLYLDPFSGQVKLEIDGNKTIDNNLSFQLLFMSLEVIKQIRLENAKKGFFPLEFLIKNSYA